MRSVLAHHQRSFQELLLIQCGDIIGRLRPKTLDEVYGTLAYGYE